MNLGVVGLGTRCRVGIGVCIWIAAIAVKNAPEIPVVNTGDAPQEVTILKHMEEGQREMIEVSCGST